MNTQPRRLMESAAGEDLLVRAVQAARTVEPSPVELDALQQRLLEALADTPSQTPGLLPNGAARRIAAVGLVMLGAFGAYVALRAETPAPRPPAAVQKTTPASLPKEVVDVPPAAAPATPVEVPAAMERPRPPRAAKVAMPAEPVETLGELDLLRDAEAALRQDPTAALQLTDRHLRAYPSGILAQEREVIGVQALLGMGKRAEAEARAERFRSAYPTSPLLRRLSRVLARAASVGNEAPVETSTPREVKP